MDDAPDFFRHQAREVRVLRAVGSKIDAAELDLMAEMRRASALGFSLAARYPFSAAIPQVKNYWRCAALAYLPRTPP